MSLLAPWWTGGGVVFVGTIVASIAVDIAVGITVASTEVPDLTDSTADWNKITRERRPASGIPKVDS